MQVNRFVAFTLLFLSSQTLCLISSEAYSSTPKETKKEGQNAYVYELTTITGEIESLNQFRGKVLLIVNIATQCGLTSQLKDLEELYQAHKAEGLVIIGIPSNDFGGQTPQENKDVLSFCQKEYRVSFPIFAKTKVLGKNKHPLFKFLLAEAKIDEISWNFQKFLIGRQGQYIDYFHPFTFPKSAKIKNAINKLL